MKLTEALEPLFESFSQLRTFLEREEETGSFESTEVIQYLRTLRLTMNNIRNYDSSAPSVDERSFSAKELSALFRWAMQHPNLPEEMKSDAQTGTVIRILRNRGIEAVFAFLISLISDIGDSLTDPRRQKPQITRIESGNGWESFQLHNYAAAREVCNRYGATFCIGSSSIYWFDDYGRDEGRDTFAIVINNSKVVIVHSGPRSFLITASDNEHQFDSYEEAIDNPEDVKKIVDDFGDIDTAHDAILSVMHHAHWDTIDAIMNEIEKEMHQ